MITRHSAITNNTPNVLIAACHFVQRRRKNSKKYIYIGNHHFHSINLNRMTITTMAHIPRAVAKSVLATQAVIQCGWRCSLARFMRNNVAKMKHITLTDIEWRNVRLNL